MLDLNKAKEIAEDLTRQLNVTNDPKVGLLLDKSIESEFCYIFFYQSTKYIQSNNPLDMIVGHGPILVDKRNGVLVQTGSAHSTEYYVKNYEERGDPFKEPSLQVLLSEWRQGANAVKAIKLVRRHSNLGLGGAKHIIDSCLSGTEMTVSAKDTQAADALVIDLKSAGFVSKRI